MNTICDAYNTSLFHALRLISTSQVSCREDGVPDVGTMLKLRVSQGHIYNIKLIRIVNPNLVKSRLRITYLPVTQSSRKFAHSTAVVVPCSVQKMVRQPETEFMNKRVFAIFEFSGGIKDNFPIFHRTPDFAISHQLRYLTAHCLQNVIGNPWWLDKLSTKKVHHCSLHNSLSIWSFVAMVIVVPLVYIELALKRRKKLKPEHNW